MHDIAGFTTEPLEEIMGEIMDVAERWRVRVSRYVGVGEIQERTATTPEELTEDDLVGMSASEPGPGDGK